MAFLFAFISTSYCLKHVALLQTLNLSLCRSEITFYRFVVSLFDFLLLWWHLRMRGQHLVVVESGVRKNPVYRRVLLLLLVVHWKPVHVDLERNNGKQCCHEGHVLLLCRRLRFMAKLVLAAKAQNCNC